MEKSRDFYLSVCAVLGLLLLPIHITGDEYNSMMRVSTIFHWRLPTRAAFPRSDRVAAIPNRTIAGESSIWVEDSANCLDYRCVSVVPLWVCIKKPDQSAFDMRDASNSHLPSLISLSLSNLQYTYNYFTRFFKSSIKQSAHNEKAQLQGLMQDFAKTGNDQNTYKDCMI